MAARAAAATLRERLAAFAAQRFHCTPADVSFAGGRVRAGEHALEFAELVDAAYHARVQLSATGFYATPKIHYDRTTLSGRPFFYFAYGAAVAEVAIDTLTGEHRLCAVDILHDAGASLNPAIDRGQIEGGFMTAGRGWIALALVVFATWKPSRVVIGAYLFGSVTLAQFQAQAAGVAIPSQLLAMLPYVATIVVLAIISRDATTIRLNAPASLGKPYHPE